MMVLPLAPLMLSIHHVLLCTKPASSCDCRPLPLDPVPLLYSVLLCPSVPLQDVPAGDRLCEAYLHRIGRSTRLARKGVAITFVASGKREDEAAMASIEEFYHIAVPELPDTGIPREDLRNSGEAF